MGVFTSSPCALARPQSFRHGVGARSDGWTLGVRFRRLAVGVVELGSGGGAGAFIVSVVGHSYLISLLSLLLTMPSYLSTMPTVLALALSSGSSGIDLTEQGLGNLAWDFAERANSGTNPGDLAERVNLGTNPKDLAERANSGTNPRDLVEMANSSTNPGDFAERVNSGTNPGGFGQEGELGHKSWGFGRDFFFQLRFSIEVMVHLMRWVAFRVVALHFASGS
ncbi:hypothetical protein BHE74_00022801 [Ensete ventricosum]|nr:hypothetical protein BHE74_00022801 [Ensete ventricosum]RZR99498.1 hypothetical protein BHM03_00029061 [Ensete ventricosum]